MNIFDLAAKITLDTSEYDKGVSNAGNTLSSFGDKMKSAFGGIAKVASAAYGVASATVGVLGKQAIAVYGDYEQLVGGVDTLFKKSSQKVQKYAANAYKTAGVSVNKYMETVTSFSASLLQSLAGDTDKAADVADMALRDMSDNANKMGTSMESIQNAYQGFAKQNYMMLDNLKLGYGGTKTEMERLLADAEKLSGIKYDISNLSDVYEAIHVIQTEIGITGTTAKEAATTIQGSAAAMKAAFQNLLIGISDSSQNFEKLFDDFTESAKTFLSNLMPRIKDSIVGIGKFSTAVAPMIIDAIVDIAPDLIAAGGDLIVALVDGIVKNIPKLVRAEKTIVKTLIENIGKIIPSLIEGFKSLRGELGTVERTALDVAVAFFAYKKIKPIIETLSSAIKTLMSHPYVAIAGAIAVGLLYCVNALKSATGWTYKYSDAQKELIERGADARNSIDESSKSFAKSSLAIEVETKKTQELWAELQTLADENGHVKESDQDRAQYILGELNEALGTEYDMNEGIIGQYQAMQQEIDNLIKKRQAERTLAVFEEHVQTQQNALDDVLREVQVQQDAYDATLEQARIGEGTAIVELRSLLRDYYDMYGELPQVIKDAATGYISIDTDALDPEFIKRVGIDIESWVDSYNYWVDAVNDVTDKLAAAESTAEGAYSAIATYSKAQALIEVGQYEEAIRLIDEQNNYRWHAAEERGRILEVEREEMKSELDFAIWYADWYKEKLEEGLEGFDPVGAQAAADRAEELTRIWNKLVGESEKIGEEISEGLAAGIAARAVAVSAAAGAVAAGAIAQMKITTQVASPSKVTRAFGRFIDEGLALGMEDEAESVRRAADMVARYAIPSVGGIASADGYGSGSAGNSTSIGNIILNVDAQGVSSVERLADLVADRINRDVLRRVAAT